MVKGYGPRGGGARATGRHARHLPTWTTRQGCAMSGAGAQRRGAQRVNRSVGYTRARGASDVDASASACTVHAVRGLDAWNGETRTMSNARKQCSVDGLDGPRKRRDAPVARSASIKVKSAGTDSVAGSAAVSSSSTSGAEWVTDDVVRLLAAAFERSRGTRLACTSTASNTVADAVETADCQDRDHGDGERP